MNHLANALLGAAFMSILVKLALWAFGPISGPGFVGVLVLFLPGFALGYLSHRHASKGEGA